MAENNGSNFTQIATGSGTAVQALGTQTGYTFSGASGVTTSGSGSTITITGSGSNTGWVLIQTQTASSSASITFTTGITSTYNVYVLVYNAIVPATTGATFQMQYSTNGGSSYVSTGYNTGYIQSTSFSVGYTTGVASSTAAIFQVCSASAGASSGANFYLYNLATSTPATYIGQAVDGVATSYWSAAGAFGNSTTPINALKVLFSTGNIASGKISLYGISN